MAATRTPGITRSAPTADSSSTSATTAFASACAWAPSIKRKRKRGEMVQIDADLDGPMSSRPRFSDCAARYLMQSQDLRSLEAIRIHVRLLVPFIGHLQPHQVHDGTLAPFISAPSLPAHAPRQSTAA